MPNHFFTKTLQGSNFLRNPHPGSTKPSNPPKRVYCISFLFIIYTFIFFNVFLWFSYFMPFLLFMSLLSFVAFIICILFYSKRAGKDSGTTTYSGVRVTITFHIDREQLSFPDRRLRVKEENIRLKTLFDNSLPTGSDVEQLHQTEVWTTDLYYYRRW